ncbi:hypothetical protein L195_g054106, partial [Trifolium pratense]
MLGDYEIGEFKLKWAQVVDSIGLKDNNWIKETYAKRKTWATTHIHGQMFAGFRTTSRYKGLHFELGKFVNSRYNLSDFLLHFHRCLNYMRCKEVFTREIFGKLQIIIQRSSSMTINGFKETRGYKIYELTKYRKPEKVWRVSFNRDGDILKCSCQRMESFGIP